MSLATRCTHCGTIFKVVQDQLKVSEGWVRCGRCHEVFHALPSLFDLDSEPPPPRQVPPSAPTAPHTPASKAAPPVAHPPEPATPDEQPWPADDSGIDSASEEGSDGDWRHTRPTELAPPTPIAAHTPLTAADLAMEATPLPSATEFELDTAVGMPLTAPAPWPAPPTDEVPDTDESDALDSRYLLPSLEVQRQVKRRPSGPEFADAQFPSDAMLDAEEAWAQDSLPAEVPEPTWQARVDEATAQAAAEASEVARLAAIARNVPPHPAASLLRSPSPSDPLSAPAPRPLPLPDGEDDPSIPTTVPSRFGDPFVPEQVQPPPSQRKGRSGTRGRDPATQAPEFVKRAQRQAFWRHGGTRSVLVLLLLTLSAGLGLQLMHQFRDLIAADSPQARPWLVQWCEQVGCQIRPPLRLEVLQVDSATLLRTASEGPDRYRLTVAVHNRSDIGVAWPQIDLSLTDDRGSVIGRRAFVVSDARVVRNEATASAAGSASTPPEAVPAQQSTTLQWSLRLDDLTPAGYTAELFYP